MTTYRERREAKADRLREWADKRDVKSAQAHDTADTIADRIPFGQPILVGHHSERGHRRDIARIDGAMGKAVEHSAKAQDMRSRAENIERAAAGAIYSDDPDAVEQLTAKLAGLEASRERIKAYNRTCSKRAKVGLDALTDEMREQWARDMEPLTGAEKRDLLTCIRVQGYQCKGGKFPSYVLSNMGGVITSTRKRLEQLSAPERARVITARYAGECRECGATINEGDTIRYYRRSRSVACESCES